MKDLLSDVETFLTNQARPSPKKQEKHYGIEICCSTKRYIEFCKSVTHGSQTALRPKHNISLRWIQVTKHSMLGVIAVKLTRT